MSDANLRSLQNGGVAVPSPLARHTNRGLTVDVSHKELKKNNGAYRYHIW
jgi:hypothetical protein